MAELDTQWLQCWRDDVTAAVGSVLATFQARMGYPPGDNRVGPPISSTGLRAIEESLPLLPADLAAFCRVVGEVSLPDMGNGWFVLSPLYEARIARPYNVDIVGFTSDGGGTVYAVPVGKPGPVLRLREVPEVAAGVYGGNRVQVSAPHLRAFLAGLRDAVRLFALTGHIADL